VPAPPATSVPDAVAAATLLATLPRPAVPPPEKGPVVPSQVQRWREDAHAAEHGDGVPRDAPRAAELYCRAARYGDAEAQYSLAWMLTNARGIERNDAQAAHLFAAAAEQGHPQALNMAARLGTPLGPPPPCLRPPEADSVARAPVRAAAPLAPRPVGAAPPLPIPAHAPAPLVTFVRLTAPDYRLEPGLVLAVMAAESNFDPGAVSPKNAQGLMQLIPDTARRFGVRDPFDPVQNIRGGMAYLRWLLAYFEGDVALALAAYNAGEGAVERYLGVPPFAETRNYVLKILVALNGRRSHPFDPGATTPSTRLPQMRAWWGG
jgi:soluble lytic murein transglycosylase-like protein